MSNNITENSFQKGVPKHEPPKETRERPAEEHYTTTEGYLEHLKKIMTKDKPAESTNPVVSPKTDTAPPSRGEHVIFENRDRDRLRINRRADEGLRTPQEKKEVKYVREVDLNKAEKKASDMKDQETSITGIEPQIVRSVGLSSDLYPPPRSTGRDAEKPTASNIYLRDSEVGTFRPRYRERELLREREREREKEAREREREFRTPVHQPQPTSTSYQYHSSTYRTESAPYVIVELTVAFLQ
jgi:hypothetical protein